MKHVHAVRCDCGRECRLVFGREIYPHRMDLFSRKFWKCDSCAAWVGCHPGGTRPLGRPANAALRKQRQSVHAAFDPLWKSGTMTRTAAYSKLAEGLGVAKQNCHIGMFDAAQCERALVVVQAIKPWRSS